MIPKSGNRFSEKIMLRQKDRAGWREKSSCPRGCSRPHSDVAANPRLFLGKAVDVPLRNRSLDLRSRRRGTSAGKSAAHFFGEIPDMAARLLLGQIGIAAAQRLQELLVVLA